MRGAGGPGAMTRALNFHALLSSANRGSFCIAGAGAPSDATHRATSMRGLALAASLLASARAGSAAALDAKERRLLRVGGGAAAVRAHAQIADGAQRLRWRAAAWRACGDGTLAVHKGKALRAGGGAAAAARTEKQERSAHTSASAAPRQLRAWKRPRGRRERRSCGRVKRDSVSVIVSGGSKRAAEAAAAVIPACLRHPRPGTHLPRAPEIVASPRLAWGATRPPTERPGRPGSTAAERAGKIARAACCPRLAATQSSRAMLGLLWGRREAAAGGGAPGARSRKVARSKRLLGGSL